jgi:hypothetical protein
MIDQLSVGSMMIDSEFSRENYKSIFATSIGKKLEPHNARALCRSDNDGEIIES